MPVRAAALKYSIIPIIRPGWTSGRPRRMRRRAVGRTGRTSTQDTSMEAERQNQIIARIDDYAERQGLLRRYL